jgi:hypothetical protein
MMSTVVVHVSCDSNYIKGFNISLKPWINKFDKHIAETDSSGYAEMLYVHNSTYTLNISRSDTALLSDTVTVSENNHVFNYLLGWPPIISGIKQADDMEQDGISIFPNPTRGTLTINPGKYKGLIEELWVVSTSGQVMLTKTPEGVDQTLELNLESFPSGVYFLVMKTNNCLIDKKISVLK